MAMVFMAHRVRLLISIFLFLYSCSDKTVQPVPNFFISSADKSLQKHEGKLFKNGKHFNGYVYALYENGDTAFVTGFKNGREEGWSRSWWPGEKKKAERFYTNGRKEWRHTGWWENGRVKFEYNFSNDELEGSSREWYENGKPFHFATYEKGHEAGRQQLWWDDGRMRANYFVKDGEQFGLIGRKICINNFNEGSR
jgi:antitoxin component YwqK of YwqJK toxin-antitoxin module